MVVVLTYRAHQHPAPILSLVHQRSPTVALGELEIVFLSIWKAFVQHLNDFLISFNPLFCISWYSFASTSQESFFPSAYPAQRKESLIVFLWPGVKIIGYSWACIWAIGDYWEYFAVELIMPYQYLQYLQYLPAPYDQLKVQIIDYKPEVVNMSWQLSLSITGTETWWRIFGTPPPEHC